MEIDFKHKRAKGKLAQNIQAVTPLVEEITDKKVLPLCLIGFSAKRNRVSAHFATISDDKATLDALAEICKQFLVSIGHPCIKQETP